MNHNENHLVDKNSQVYYSNTLKKAVSCGISKDSIFCLFYIKKKTFKPFFTQQELNQLISDYYRDEKGKETEPYKLRDKMLKEGLFIYHPKAHIPTYSIISKKDLNLKIGNSKFRVKITNEDKVSHQILINDMSLNIDRRDSYSKVKPQLKELLGNQKFAEYNLALNKRRELNAKLSSKDRKGLKSLKMTKEEKLKLSLITKKIIGKAREFSYVRFAKLYGYSAKSFKRILNEMSNLGLIDFICGAKKKGAKLFNDNNRASINSRVVNLVEEGILDLSKYVVKILDSPMSLDTSFTAMMYDAVPYEKSLFVLKTPVGYDVKKVLI